MQALFNSRRLARILKPLIFVDADVRFLSYASHVFNSIQCRNNESLSSHSIFSGMEEYNRLHVPIHPMSSMTLRADFSSEAAAAESSSTEAVKELSDKLLESVNLKNSMPPNAWLWSLIDNCRNHDDVKLLFDVLHNLRRFRLSNLRIHDNFNCNLCREVAKACVRVGAIDFGKKALWKHNVYGLTPSIASAHHLLAHAQAHKDAKLMGEIMKLLKRNGLPLQPGTADVVFRICYDRDNWELMSKYSKKFTKAGVKLRKTTFDVWMELAAKIGDTESLWKIDKLRSETYSHHTLASAFSCAKGFLLEHKPEEAAAVVEIICQILPDMKKSAVAAEFRKLLKDWPADVVKRQKEEDRKGLPASLKSNISAMVTILLNTGFKLDVNLDDLNKNEALAS